MRCKEQRFIPTLGLALLASLGLSHCGRQDNTNVYKFEKSLPYSEYIPARLFPYVNPEFKEYVDRFEDESGMQVIGKSIVDFDKVSNDEAANCTFTEVWSQQIGLPIIRVSKSYWRSFTSDAEKEMLIFHELGHCFLNLNHKFKQGRVTNPNTGASYCAPLSVMYPSAEDALVATYKANRDYYVDELLGRNLAGNYLVDDTDCRSSDQTSQSQFATKF